MTTLDYSPVTEKVGDWVTQEALSMLYTRYRFASEFCRGKRVLEVACGQGVGLGYLARHAKDAVGGDITDQLLNRAHHILQEKLLLMRLEAEALPLHEASRDVIICYEALYYLEHPMRFLRECRRVLSPQGLLLLCTANPEWPDFNPSPHSRGYYSMRQLAALLRDAGFQTEAFAGFPIAKASLRTACVSWLKRIAVWLRVIPSTMAGKRFLKRMFLGRLIPFPVAVTDGMSAYFPPVTIPSNQPIPDYKVLFILARPA